MCGRYTQLMSWSELVEIYRIFDKSMPLNIAANDDVRPTNRVPIVRGADGQPRPNPTFSTASATS